MPAAHLPSAHGADAQRGHVQYGLSTCTYSTHTHTQLPIATTPPPPPLPPLPPLPTHTHTQNITTPNQLWDYSRKNTDQCGGTARLYSWRPLNVAANRYPTFATSPNPNPNPTSNPSPNPNPNPNPNPYP